jgi:hypothetical protein
MRFWDVAHWQQADAGAAGREALAGLRGRRKGLELSALLLDRLHHHGRTRTRVSEPAGARWSAATRCVKSTSTVRAQRPVRDDHQQDREVEQVGERGELLAPQALPKGEHDIFFALGLTPHSQITGAGSTLQQTLRSWVGPTLIYIQGPAPLRHCRVTCRTAQDPGSAASGSSAIEVKLQAISWPHSAPEGHTCRPPARRTIATGRSP